MSKVNGEKITKTNQIHNFKNWDLDNLIFGDVDECVIPGSNPPIKYYRINLFTKNQKQDEEGEEVFEETKDGEKKPVTSDTLGDILLLIGRYFSFGVSESTDPSDSERITGHTLPLVLWTKEAATSEEIAVTDKIEALIERIKTHMLKPEVKKAIKKPKLEMTDLKGLSKVLYWKEDDEGNRKPGEGPTISPKLIEFPEKKDEKTGKVIKQKTMSTVFYSEDEVDEHGNPLELDPLDYVSDSKNKQFKLMYARPVIKLDNIYISGDKIRLQVKVTESDIAPVEQGQKRLLHHRTKASTTTTIMKNGVNPLLNKEKEESKEEHVDKPKKESLKPELTDEEPKEDKPAKKVTKTKVKTKTES